ncbi:LEAF RUST 10 DISEASE-RESISTANCE LOCUS RECEPTOR-LIKE PROTEIN KINASE-like 2.1 isoform X1 [Hevea brasiliensis]|uniref:LEAF RUST 10 DISEASE-RESISTANCE LOCUS RECEPTOR-LIKE PROTEIN KINASE-like 2.1 isoform X1 n=1 Tax=Hevea brasiliensis TaxID=3981 RepID=UPI0025EEAAC4|nr:LEAF RUST 10 DISEASE-RESISTANCE LOCUS RECEPTOR-LIKE PROTEIN KINASE-like 2.1 isoform X1 [Hevea brasiliensis]
MSQPSFQSCLCFCLNQWFCVFYYSLSISNHKSKQKKLLAISSLLNPNFVDFPQNAFLLFLFILLLQMDTLYFFISHKPVFTCFTAVFFFFFFNTLAEQSLTSDQKFQACAPITCGKGPKISYPFFLSNVQDAFCGYPNFDITCKHEYPVLGISNDDYIIKDIFYNNQTFLVASAVAYEEDTCPTPLHNLTLDLTPFIISPDYFDFYFLYNCTSKPPKNLTYTIRCATNSTVYSFAGFHIEKLEISSNYSLDSCNYFVNAPLHTGSDLYSLFHKNYTEILKMGFLLNWTAHTCSTCEGSGGRCGFENHEFVCFCHDRTHLNSCDDDKQWNFSPKIFVGVTCGVIGFLVACACICRSKKIPSVTSIFPFQKMVKNNQDFEDFLKNHGPLAIKRYNFSEVKKMTSLFKDKLGQGGYGSVYKGKLFDGRLVAVKLLNASKGDGQEFINEVASISRTSHVNVVTILGFCLEGKKRALIYEFMSNGSLEKFICHGSTFKIDQHLGWETMHQIAIGIARGLEYLHRGCNTRIVHFDIKPHNILLDENFCPKISDFGLAKLCTKKESTISMLEARGTVGYIAPEVFSRNFGRVSSKSDVYSYGMMVLEMVGGMEEDDEVGTDNSSEKYFPQCIYRRLEQGNNYELLGEISIEEIEIVRKLTMVGLWCIQTIPSHRPSMSKVIEMLQGSIETLNIPPKPSLSCPPPFLASSFTISVA